MTDLQFTNEVNVNCSVGRPFALIFVDEQMLIRVATKIFENFDAFRIAPSLREKLKKLICNGHRSNALMYIRHLVSVRPTKSGNTEMTSLTFTPK